MINYLKNLIGRDIDNFAGGLRFFFRCSNLHKYARAHFNTNDNRSKEENEIANSGAFNTVASVNYPELEMWMYNQIRPILEKEQILFSGSCIALMYYPNFIKSPLHIHRESLRKINDSPYNYTFYWNTNTTNSIDFNIVDHKTTYDEIVSHKLINYESTQTCQDFANNKSIVTTKMHSGDFIKFNATNTIHGATPNWNDDSIGLFLVLSGCKNYSKCPSTDT